MNLAKAFADKTFLEIYDEMKNNLNIVKMHTSEDMVTCEYPYTLESEHWKQIQIESLRQGYESRTMR